MIYVGNYLIPPNSVCAFEKIPCKDIYNFEVVTQDFQKRLQSSTEFSQYCDSQGVPIYDLHHDSCVAFNELLSELASTPVCRIHLSNGNFIDSWLTEDVITKVLTGGESVYCGCPQRDPIEPSIDYRVNKLSFGIYDDYASLMQASLKPKRTSRLL